MSKWTDAEIKDVIKKIVAKANTDAEFRKLCLENSDEAIKQVIEKEIPDDFVLKFIENEVSRTIVLPDFGSSDGELSDSDMEQIAGGTKVPIIPVIFTGGPGGIQQFPNVTPAIAVGPGGTQQFPTGSKK